jgi:hypothetical protein
VDVAHVGIGQQPSDERLDGGALDDVGVDHHAAGVEGAQATAGARA